MTSGMQALSSRPAWAAGLAAAPQHSGRSRSRRQSNVHCQQQDPLLLRVARGEGRPLAGFAECMWGRLTFDSTGAASCFLCSPLLVPAHMLCEWYPLTRQPPDPSPLPAYCRLPACRCGAHASVADAAGGAVHGGVQEIL